MIKVSVLYPADASDNFDLDYYKTKHMPMVAELTGAACKGWGVDSGLAGGAPGQGPTYSTIGWLLFDSVESFQGSFGPHAAEIMGDIPNYTKTTPIVQISNVVVG
jgi:uncharacterized protein (TIGR02118 family)